MHRSNSPFNPKVAESSKRLLLETSEQLESTSKVLTKKPTSFYDSVNNMKDSTTRRRIDFNKHNETAPFSSFVNPGGYQPNNNLNTSSVFQSHSFVQNQPSMRSTSVSRNVKGSKIIEYLAFLTLI